MSTAELFASFPGQAWAPVVARVRRAVVFLDDRCAESLHWSCGGGAALLAGGARGVRRFSRLESCGRDEPRAVFVVSSPLLRGGGATLDAIRAVLSRSRRRCRHCVVVTAVAHRVHLLADNSVTTTTSSELDGSPVFRQLEEKLCEWMGVGDVSPTAEVMHAPLTFAPVSQQLLLTPAFAQLFPLLPADLEAINALRPEKKRRFAGVADVDLPSLPAELQMQVRCLASALDSLFEVTATREESFAVGPMSRLIAGELASLPQAKHRRKTAPNKASIIFIDRTMDLTGAVGHHGDNLVEKILTVLDPLPGHVTDVQVDMSELTALRGNSQLSQGTVAPGCLAQDPSSPARALWEAMLSSKQKEAVMEVRRHLVEAASLENLPIKMSLGRVTPEQLCSYVQLFRSSWGALEEHSGVLQLALATAQTLRHTALPRWDACLGCQRLLLQALSDHDFPAVLRQLLPVMKPQGRSLDPGTEGGATEQRSSQDCGPDEMILLLIFLYSLAEEAQPGRGGEGEEEEEEEEKLEKVEREVIEALALVIVREAELSPLLQKVTGCAIAEGVTPAVARATAARVIQTLRGLSRPRDHLKQLRSVYTASDGVHQASYQPFLVQVLQEVFHPDHRDCPDLEHMSGGLTDLLKTGFSMFMKVTRPHPGDHPLLLLFLVGGVTPSELRLVREVAAAHKPGSQVMVLSTRLLRPGDVAELLLSARRLVPDLGV